VFVNAMLEFLTFTQNFLLMFSIKQHYFIHSYVSLTLVADLDRLARCLVLAVFVLGL